MASASRCGQARDQVSAQRRAAAVASMDLIQAERAVTFPERSGRSVATMSRAQPTAGRPPARIIPVRIITVALVAVMVALLAFLLVSGAATSSLAPGQQWAALSLLTIVVAM